MFFFFSGLITTLFLSISYLFHPLISLFHPLYLVINILTIELQIFLLITTLFQIRSYWQIFLNGNPFFFVLPKDIYSYKYISLFNFSNNPNLYFALFFFQKRIYFKDEMEVKENQLIFKKIWTFFIPFIQIYFVHIKRVSENS